VYIYQLVGRANSPEDAQRICDIFRHSLSRIQSPGYARGFCAVNQTDKTSVLVQEEWYNLNSFEFWKQSEGYRQLRQMMQPLIEGIWEPETYVGQA
jgi:quinol monooxygenase YgiN